MIVGCQLSGGTKECWADSDTVRWSPPLTSTTHLKERGTLFQDAVSINRLNHVNKKKRVRNNNTYSEWEAIKRLPPLVGVESTQPNGDGTPPVPPLPATFKRHSITSQLDLFIRVLLLLQHVWRISTRKLRLLDSKQFDYYKMFRRLYYVEPFKGIVGSRAIYRQRWNYHVGSEIKMETQSFMKNDPEFYVSRTF